MAIKRFLAGLLALICLFGMSMAEVRVHAEETGVTDGTGDTAETSETETPADPVLSATAVSRSRAESVLICFGKP